jgi:hypothetical protein
MNGGRRDITFFSLVSFIIRYGESSSSELVSSSVLQEIVYPMYMRIIQLISLAANILRVLLVPWPASRQIEQRTGQATNKT